MSAETAAVLRAARAKVAQGWTQGAFARSKAGTDALPWGLIAVCWCATGAIGSDPEVDQCDEEPAHRALGRIVTASGEFDSVADWNDAPGRTQAEVLAAFDRAIAAEEADRGR